ncbi:efflux RND transporter periplasmic adaptor subunit [Bradyrhizobium betae]|uniref:efflux RND transporter periplasmic adaptor subunit n=1 Tax=Bradyrhizobium betae TaxID=244734 RepID=UPI003D669AC5
MAVLGVGAAGLFAFRYLYPHAVEGTAVVRSTLALSVNGPGTLDAINKIVVSSRSQGRLTEITVDRNDTITAGQILARIESYDLRHQLAAAQASEQAAIRAIEVAKASRTRADATLVNARTNYERQAALIDKGFTSQQNFDAAEATLRQAAADLAHDDQVIEQTRSQAQSAAANVGVVQAQIDDTIVRAPFPGIVVSRDRNIGDTLTIGASILQLVDPATIVLTARFDESTMQSMKPGQPVCISFASQPGKNLSGHVLRLGRIVDTETREFTLDVKLDTLPENWALGQRGLASITVATLAQVPTLPKSFLVRRHGRVGVWVVEGGRAYWRTVEPGAAGVDRVEIRQGLAPGEITLVPDGVYRFMKVQVRGAPT